MSELSGRLFEAKKKCIYFKSGKFLSDFYEKHLDLLDWQALCANSNVPIDFIEKYIDKIIMNNSLEKMWENINTSIEFYEKYFDIIDWDAISSNKYVPVHFVRKYSNKMNWDLLSSNIKIPTDLFEQNINALNWDKISSNEGIDYTFLEKNISKVNWEKICANVKIPQKLFENHIENVIPEIISANSGISLYFFEKYPEKTCLQVLCSNENIYINFFESYIENRSVHKKFKFGNNKLNWSALCKRKTITNSFCEKYLEKMDWDALCESQDYCFFAKHLSKLNIERLSRIKSISLYELEQFFGQENFDISNMPWVWACNLNLPFYKKNQNNVDWNLLCSNNCISTEFFEEIINDIPNIYWKQLCSNNFDKYKNFSYDCASNSVSNISDDINRYNYFAASQGMKAYGNSNVPIFGS